MARWVMKVPGAAPCQCHSPGRVTMVSPAWKSSTGCPRCCTRPRPSKTCRICPSGCRCHAVRAPGLKWTRATRSRDGGAALAIGSIQTVPVNRSAGGDWLSGPVLMTCMSCPSGAVPPPADHRPAQRQCWLVADATVDRSGEDADGDGDEQGEEHGLVVEAERDENGAGGGATDGADPGDAGGPAGPGRAHRGGVEGGGEYGEGHGE